MPSVLFLSTLAVLAVAYLAGIRQDLPYIVDIDEPSRVARVATMIAHGDLNPHWFGHPASTVFYPLYLLTYLWNVVFLGGPLWGPCPDFTAAFEQDSAPFYVLGRMVTISYGLMSVPVFYLVGRHLFGAKVALLGVWFSSVYLVTVAHAQVVRSDSAGLFFSLLSIWLVLKYHDHPSVPNYLLAGVAVGLAVSSRYFMAFFVLPLLLAEAYRLWPLYRAGQLSFAHVGRAALGPLAVGVGFALSSPYFFLDFQTALASVTREARDEHFGFDGLSPLGNFAWYLTYALPWSVTWPQLLLAVAGTLRGFWRSRPVPTLASLGILVYLGALSVHPLHNQRWTIQALPFIALLAASALVWLQESLSGYWRLRGGRANALLAVFLVVLLAVPAYDAALFAARQTNYGTRIRAREWVIANWPRGATAYVDEYTIHFPGKYSLKWVGRRFDVDRQTVSVFQSNTLESYVREGIQYIVVSDDIYGRVLGEPERYAAELASYRRLFANYPMIAEFKPSPARPGTEEWVNLPVGRGTSGGGPLIRIYRIQP